MPPKCSCDRPRIATDPRREGWCANCLRELDPRWLSSDQNIRSFYDTLERVPGFSRQPSFRREAERREREGRDEFGLAYLTRDNVAEGCEEASDGGNYAYFEILKSRRDGKPEPFGPLMEAAHFFALAHAALVRARLED